MIGYTYVMKQLYSDMKSRRIQRVIWQSGRNFSDVASCRYHSTVHEYEYVTYTPPSPTLQLISYICELSPTICVAISSLNCSIELFAITRSRSHSCVAPRGVLRCTWGSKKYEKFTIAKHKTKCICEFIFGHLNIYLYSHLCGVYWPAISIAPPAFFPSCCLVLFLQLT